MSACGMSRYHTHAREYLTLHFAMHFSMLVHVHKIEWCTYVHVATFSICSVQQRCFVRLENC